LTNLGVFAKFKEFLPLFKQTYYIPFIWALTWYSYWIIMDITFWHKINALNVGAAMISASFVVSAIPIRNGVHKAFNFVAPQISRSLYLALSAFKLQTRKLIQILPINFANRSQTYHFIQIEKLPSQPARRVIQKQVNEPKPMQRVFKSQPALSSASGCPKNLAYFSQRPRPKQTPEECITCKNLISCVCQTSS
jgi:hypothetical protein